MFTTPRGKFKRVQSTAAIASRCHPALGRKPSTNVNCAQVSLDVEMQCFICVTYMIILCSGNPTKTRDMDKYDKFSLVNNFISSLFHTKPSEEINDNEENKLTHNYDKYGYDNYQNLLNAADFLPRRNDRIAMPPLQYRLPKSMRNTTIENKFRSKAKEEVVLKTKKVIWKPKEEVVLEPNEEVVLNPLKEVIFDTKEDVVLEPTEELVIYINKNKSQDTINFIKGRSRLSNKDKNNQNENISETDIPGLQPFSTSLAGQSQIGHRESQTVVKPTVIVNFRGSVTNRDSDIRLDKGIDRANDTDITRNVFNVSQEINLNSKVDLKKMGSLVKQGVKGKKGNKPVDDGIMCNTSFWREGPYREKKITNVMKILLTCLD